MNVLIEIGHPAHVHFFSDAIRRLPEHGHSVHVVTRNKDITNSLLDRAGIPYTCFSRPARSLPGLLRELGHRWWKTGRLLRERRIDLAVSISGITTSFPARVRGIRNLVFTDTEDAALSNRIAFPFADRIFTPRFFLRDLGRKHARYQGLHELAYLQDFDFGHAAQEREALGLAREYTFVRVVANDALHDRDIRGLGAAGLRALIDRLLPMGAVYLSSEGPLPPELERYRLRVPVEKIHAVLAGARAFIGESPTMAVESSLLGTPAFLISERVARLGNMVHLERDYGLLRNRASWEGFDPARALEADPKLEWAARAERFRQEAVPMRRFILDSILGSAG